MWRLATRHGAAPSGGQPSFPPLSASSATHRCFRPQLFPSACIVSKRPARFPPPLFPAQLDSLGSGTNQLSVSVGTAVLVATCSDLLAPTAFNLIGAMDLHQAMQSMRLNGGGGDAAPGLLPVPALSGAASGDAVRRVLADGPLLGCTAEVNPMAAAALRVLHPDEVAAATHPLGGRARPMTVDAELGKPTQPGQWLVRARTTWRCTQPEDDDALAAEERRVWQEVAQPAAVRDDDAMKAALEPLLALRRRSGMGLSPRLVHRLLMLAAGARCGCLPAAAWAAAGCAHADLPPLALHLPAHLPRARREGADEQS